MASTFKGLDDLIRSATGQAIQDILSPLLEDERAKQDAMSDKLSALEADESDKEDLDEAEDDAAEEEKEAEEAEPTVAKKIATGKEEPDEPKAVVPSPNDISKVELGQIVNMLNMLRSGKSTKDPDVKKSLKGYFDGLGPGEQQALFILLSGLSQILAGGVSGVEAPDPAAVGIKISARRATSDVTKKDKAAAAASTATSKGEKPKPGSKELPIVVGEVADKRADRRKLRLLS